MRGGPRSSLTVVGLNHDVHEQRVSCSLDGQCPLYEGTGHRRPVCREQGSEGSRAGGEAGKARTVADAGVERWAGRGGAGWGRGSVSVE